MEVATESAKLAQSRRMQLMFLLRSHPLECPVCDAAGDCRLQRLTHEYEIGELPFPRETRSFHKDNDTHFLRLNMDVCVKCGLCVRVCDELQGESALSFVNRGAAFDVSPDFGWTLDCEFCGQCAQICPVGAISSKWLVGTGRQFELKETRTVCSFCSLGCSLALKLKEDKIVYVESPEESPNQGALCVKGRYGWPYVHSTDRLTKPLIRKDRSLVEVEWEEALRFVAKGFTRIKQESGPSSLAALGSARLTNEEAYVFNRFVRTVLETSHLDHGGGYACRASIQALGRSLGYPACTNSIREIRNAQVILLLGTDLAETHPVAKNEAVIATGPRNGGRLIVVDSRRTNLWDRPGAKLVTRPGTEHLVANAMLKSIIDKRLYDPAGVVRLTEGFDELVASLEPYHPEAVGELTGVNPAQIRAAAEEYARAPKAIIVLATGMNQAGYDTDMAQAAVNLALITGHVGKESCGVLVLGEKANSQGAIDMGLAPDLLPGFRNLSDLEARAKFETAWGCRLPDEQGVGAPTILKRAEAKEIRGLYVVGENPVDSYPDRRQCKEALTALDFLVVQDLFLTSTARMAHAVLPVASFAEKIGTYTSAERRIQLLRPAFQIPGPKSDLEIFQALANLMGRSSLEYPGPEQVMAEIAALVDVYKGISYSRLNDHGLQWPCLSAEEPGTGFLYGNGFPHGKVKLLPAPELTYAPPDPQAMDLILGVVKFHSGSLSQRSTSLMEVSPEGFAEMNGSDLQSLGLKDGATATITSGLGRSIDVKVKKSARPAKGSIIIAYHFSALRLNTLTSWNDPVVRVRLESSLPEHGPA
jgi:formate dehydrogenase alpha subunit